MATNLVIININFLKQNKKNINSHLVSRIERKKSYNASHIKKFTDIETLKILFVKDASLINAHSKLYD